MRIYIDENMPPQLAEGLSILEKPNDSSRQGIYLLGNGRANYS